MATKLGSGDWEASPWAAKNTGVVLVPFLHTKVHPYSYFQWCGYFWSPWVSFVSTDELSVKVTKITSRICLMNSQPTFLFSTYLKFRNRGVLSKTCKQDNFESHNSPNLSLTIIWGLCSNFLDCKDFLESNSPDILAMCETGLDDSNDSGNFYVTGYLLLIWKDSSTHMHGLTVYVKEGLPFAWDLSLENSADSYVFDWLYFTQCLTSFSSISHLLHLCA